MNKHCAGWFAMLLVLVGAGCDTTNHVQYQVLGRTRLDGTRAVVSSDDRDAVKEILQKAAKDLRYEDRMQQTLTPNVFASYAQPDIENPIAFLGWVTEQKTIVVDILQRPDEIGESATYENVKNTLLSALRTRFGDRVEIVSRHELVPSRTIYTK